jgi:cyclopropane fatty-acyl-phospholipid synthase-like methyltransferase
VFWLRRRNDTHALAVAMTGVNLGDQLLLIGAPDGSLATAIASKVGFSGRASVLALDSAEADAARQAAARAGVLVEIETSGDVLPFDAAAFNLVVVNNQAGLLASLQEDRRRHLLAQAHAALQPRGRIVVINRVAPSGLSGLFASSAAAAGARERLDADTMAALEQTGFRPVRLLAERGGMSFIEGVR